MDRGEINSIDSYQNPTFSSVDDVKSACYNWCQDIFDSQDFEPHCCFYSKAKASGVGIELCQISKAQKAVPLDEQIFLEQGADEV